jgi:signal transduction histidine kinase
MQLEIGNGLQYIENTLPFPEKLCESKVKEIAAHYNRQGDLVLNLTHSTVCIGETEFLKIVEELTDNAFKFSSAGKKVTVGCQSGDGRFVLTVNDQGRGILDSDISRIGAFMQFDRKKFEQQGSGLGLIITKKLIGLFKGDLVVKSNAGEGTTVAVSLPEPQKS